LAETSVAMHTVVAVSKAPRLFLRPCSLIQDDAQSAHWRRTTAERLTSKSRGILLSISQPNFVSVSANFMQNGASEVGPGAQRARNAGRPLLRFRWGVGPIYSRRRMGPMANGGWVPSRTGPHPARDTHGRSPRTRGCRRSCKAFGSRCVAAYLLESSGAACPCPLHSPIAQPGCPDHAVPGVKTLSECSRPH
jgi:hypothetical protein